MKSFDILVAGEINPDLILFGDVAPAFGQVEKLVDSAALTIGSSSAIFACGAARLGLKVVFIGMCADDAFGRFMLEAMRQRDVDVHQVIQVPGGDTGLSVILNRGNDRAILTHAGLIAALPAEAVSDDLLRQARHLHVASYFLQTALQPGLPGLFQRARDLGLTTSLDTNWDPAETWIGLADLLPHTSVFLPNAAEAVSLTRAADVESAAHLLAARVACAAIKMGAQGGLACRSVGAAPGRAAHAEIIRSPSIPVHVVDTVGAGDSFDAGFLYGYLKGWELEQALRLACACGALSTQQAGGTNGQPTLAEALSRMP
jgi:sugar/nucleoside kinase (ribokinase family)